MRNYLGEKGIPVRINGYDRETRSSQEILNGQKGSEPWTPRSYSCDPDYKAVSSDVFDLLNKPVPEDVWRVIQE